jgi:hypothetical protein
MRVIVTRPNNVVEEKDGEIKLINEDDIGYLMKTHIVSTVNPVTNETGFSVLLQVHWELHRTPAVSFHAPNELYWVNFLSDSDEENEETDDVDDVNDDNPDDLFDSVLTS